MFKDKIITVFGGTGTIGSLIVEELRKYNPKTIRIFSNDENSLWDCQQKWYEKNFRFLLGDIRDLERVRIAVKGVDYVFNAAAVKHVPFCEYNPMEAVSVNIIGLSNILNVCIEHRIKKILHISTDKACNPSTVMGASKLICERLLQIRWSQDPQVKMVCVRLGNVWNSRGSIGPLIHECQKQHKPFPLTSIDMTRYFMQPEEVIEFIFKSFKEGGNGEIFIPKLKIVKILDLLHGEAGIDYPYEVIGIRKGEKMNEALITEEELRMSIENEKYWIIKNEVKL